MIRVEFAPLEGITDAVYRRVHRRFYPGVCKYYTPFLSPTQHHCFTARQKRELAPENNPDVPLVPQLLGKNAADFLWAAGELAAMGYGEVNLNLGCPSGTVTAKGKGAGFLAHPEALDRFLEEVYAAAPVKVSIKTRLGMESPEEFDRLLAIYDRYPVHRLIIHPRTRREQYRGGVHRDAFARALANTTIPVTYNGNLFTPEDCRRFQAEFPAVDTVMLGRGLAADPALAGKLAGGPGDKARLRAFHRALCEEYPVVFGDRSNAAHRIKAIWHYMLASFRGGEAYRKRLVKAKTWEALMAVTDEIFETLELLPAAQVRDWHY